MTSMAYVYLFEIFSRRENARGSAKRRPQDKPRR